jgi:ABC-2 type transport system permease protein
MFKRIWTIFASRNKEFYRDKAAFGWNILFPLFIIIGFSFMFGTEPQAQYKVGIVGSLDNSSEVIQNYIKTKYTDFIEFETKEEALDRLTHHRIDLVLVPAENGYFVSETSPSGYISEKLLLFSQLDNDESVLTKKVVQGREIPYVEWLVPGVLGMNLMFSALFGVGYVIVRYRRNNVLKRLSVTPLNAFEFLTAQVLSRVFIMVTVALVLFLVIILMFGFTVEGSFLDIAIMFFFGSTSMVSIGLIIASRGTSEEMAEGLLNLLTWPMMFLSEVWFSLEGTAEWVRIASKAMPLTYLVDGVRKIMNDGYSLSQLSTHIIVLSAITVVGMTIGSLMFSWVKR